MTINKYLLEEKFQEWKDFIEAKDGKNFTSFSSSNYLEEQENYKRTLVETAKKILDISSWNQGDIGTGQIVKRVIDAIEIDTTFDGEKIKNNLVFTSQHSYTNKPHQKLLDAQESKDTAELETVLFNFYTDKASDATSFQALTAILGKKYPLIAYLFFIKNRRKYLPISPTNFEKGFNQFNINVKFSHQCSWENYTLYIDLIKQVKDFLSEELDENIELVDAHSFIWILTRQMDLSKSEPSLKYEVVLSKFDIGYVKEEPKVLRERKEIDIYTEEDRDGNDKVKKFIGDEGEYHVLQYEIQKLKECGLVNLSEQIERVSKNSDAHGYDIKSYNKDGQEIKIEVKTTTSKAKQFTFYLTRHELKTALSIKENHYLYCVQLREGDVPLLHIIHNPFSEIESQLNTVHTATGMNISSNSFKIRVKFI